ncbi:MAG TPA: hypothetical protein ENN21_09605 [Spirochaetes bacterium]|nr:hypothetical protein [Spirochaetota bacterium]
MKLKYILASFICLLTAVTFAQIFSVPPYAGDIYAVYRSGYFGELERCFDVIKDAFVETKMLSKTEYGWILLEDIQKKHGIDVRVYDAAGRRVPAPGQALREDNRAVMEIVGSLNPSMRTEPRGRRIHTAIPVMLEDRCRFCHTGAYKNGVVGVLAFERPYDAHVYYSSERVLIFSALSALLLGLLYLVMRWDPERKVKELFDKT